MRARASGILGGLLMGLLLSACAASTQPAGPDIRPAALEDGAIVTGDGARLPLRSWLPTAAPKAVIVAAHGMNDYSNAFDGPGKGLAAQGIAVYAYDQRGFGQAPHPGWWSSTETMAADLRTVSRLLAARHGPAPLYLLGESMGGAVVIEATVHAPPPEVRGIILSAPAVWGRASMPWYQRAALWLSYKVAPGWTLTGRGLKIMPSDNIEMLRALSRDPLVIKETRVDAIHGMVDLMDAAQRDAPRLDLPLLLLYGAHDQIIPPEPTWDAVAALPHLGTRQRAALYANGWHMLLRDLQAQVVVDDIAAWVADQTAPLPSGADRAASGKLETLAAETR
ncbi:alpha/beta hydrolase [Paramagnetospirillum magneticum]|uniref:Lysophospholipase n=1 Tax=Paramagnetospirillum magneticum (strain ATCC 700264 / AMB-1) TaxID=342108 RepID=Q2VZF7_PARM1|nr:alpha/beta hydrolase [Paramagnetospirillum magneticum]BAE53018.1 Lysophospholipase [Paramagnetospirillum magneticum AMB-1]